VFFSGGVMRAREALQPCQLRFENVLEHALVNMRVKSAGIVRANSTGASIAKA
jgi:hypothetical protein